LNRKGRFHDRPHLNIIRRIREIKVEMKRFDRIVGALELIAPRRLMLAEAIAAIHWAALCGFEWDLAILLAVVADCLVHFPWCPVVHL
jgi:hypothetical protein